jgi:hypothetical protein
MEQQRIDADAALQEVLNAWGVIRTGPGPQSLNPDFSALFDKMQAYRTAKSLANNRREHNKLTEQAAAQEQTTTQEFMTAYRAFYAKHVNRTDR